MKMGLAVTPQVEPCSRARKRSAGSGVFTKSEDWYGPIFPFSQNIRARLLCEFSHSSRLAKRDFRALLDGGGRIAPPVKGKA